MNITCRWDDSCNNGFTISLNCDHCLFHSQAEEVIKMTWLVDSIFLMWFTASFYFETLPLLNFCFSFWRDHLLLYCSDYLTAEGVCEVCVQLLCCLQCFGNTGSFPVTQINQISIGLNLAVLLFCLLVCRISPVVTDYPGLLRPLTPSVPQP